jgi:hypothetical protein
LIICFLIDFVSYAVVVFGMRLDLCGVWNASAEALAAIRVTFTWIIQQTPDQRLTSG